MNILGLSFDFHDAAAVLLRDGKVEAASLEERFSRVKHDRRLPQKAIRFCLESAGIGPNDLDEVAYYEFPMLKLDRILRRSLFHGKRGRAFLKEALEDWHAHNKFDPAGRIARFLDIKPQKIKLVKHHVSHAYSTFYCSPFERATVVTIDAVGEYDTAKVWLADNQEWKRIATMHLPQSIGLFYSAFTAYLGFEVNEGEYKVMGMAAFGKPSYADQIRKLYELRSDGTVRFKQKYFHFDCPEDVPFSKAFVDLFGEARLPESAFDPRHSSGQHFADMAASIQLCTEEIIMHIVSCAVKATGVKEVCLAGGVAMNTAANAKLQEQGFRLFVQPSAGDAGGALGAALARARMKGLPRHAMQSAFLGLDTEEEDIALGLEWYPQFSQSKYDSEEELLRQTAENLRGGSVIGWMQGRAEWGARALGNRSILADPSRPDMKGIVNEKIKYREPFRPFAPAVMAEHASDYFEMEKAETLSDPEYFMLSLKNVRPEKRDQIPAITHEDGSARVQLVSEETNPRFYRLIKEFAGESGVPMLLNTSFNLRGEPIVNTPSDALKTFDKSGMDHVVIGNHLISKN